jgi:hypothetical protein
VYVSYLHAPYYLLPAESLLGAGTDTSFPIFSAERPRRRPGVIEPWRYAAGGDELEFTGSVNAVVEGHGAGEHTLDAAGPERNVPSGSQTPNPGCLRQPARMLFRGRARNGDYGKFRLRSTHHG